MGKGRQSALLSSPRKRMCALCWIPSPRPRPLAPSAPTRVAPLRSSTSQRLWRGQTSPVRSSSATAPHLPDAIRTRASAPDGRETFRFPRREFTHMPGSQTSPGRRSARDCALPRRGRPRRIQKSHAFLGARRRYRLELTRRVPAWMAGTNNEPGNDGTSRFQGKTLASPAYLGAHALSRG